MSPKLTRDHLRTDCFFISDTHRKEPKGRIKEFVRAKFVRLKFAEFVSPFGPFFSLSPLLALLILMAASCARGVDTGAISGADPYPAKATKVKYERLTIPGMGRSYLNCGEFIKLVYCEACDYSKKIFRSCDRCFCPTCWSTWARKEKDRIITRLYGYDAAYAKVKGARMHRLRDTMVSPPQEEACYLVRTEEGTKKLKSQAIKLLRRFGVGGALIYHERRIRKEIKPRLGKVNAEPGEHFWDLVRRDALCIGGLDAYSYISPHFHILGYGDRFVNGGEVCAKTGWVWKNKGNIDNEAVLAKKALYMLNHCAVREGKQAVTWFGALSYNKLKKHDGTPVEVVVICPKCGSELSIKDIESGEVARCVRIVPVSWYEIVNRKKKRSGVGQMRLEIYGVAVPDYDVYKPVSAFVWKRPEDRRYQ